MPRTRLRTGPELHWVRGGRRDPGAETVVFVNGLTMDTTAWGPVADLVGERYATVRYDGRGQGESEAPGGIYTPWLHAADLDALLDALELGRVHLVGLSNGGLVAMLLAGELSERDPERIASVSAIDSFLRVDPLLTTVLNSWKAALAAGGSALRFDVATPWVWGHAFLARHLDEVLAFRERAAEADPEVIRRLIDGLLDFGGAERLLRAYRGPLLALVGRDDVLTPPRHSRAIVDWARRGRLVLLEDAGHAAPIERPGAVARQLLHFLTDLGEVGLSDPPAPDPEDARDVN